MSHGLDNIRSMSTNNKISIDYHKIHTKQSLDKLASKHKNLKDKVDLFDVSEHKAICSADTGLTGNVKLYQHLKTFKKETDLNFTTINGSLSTHNNNIFTTQSNHNRLSDNSS
eukprot:10814288-Ditylum_brightwellii.AAC.1